MRQGPRTARTNESKTHREVTEQVQAKRRPQHSPQKQTHRHTSSLYLEDCPAWSRAIPPSIGGQVYRGDTAPDPTHTRIVIATGGRCPPGHTTQVQVGRPPGGPRQLITSGESGCMPHGDTRARARCERARRSWRRHHLDASCPMVCASTLVSEGDSIAEAISTGAPTAARAGFILQVRDL